MQDRQLLERPKHLTWEESACYTLVLATAYRMLFGHRPHVLRPGHNVLVWGASGGLGSMAVQLCATSGANAIGVVSEEDKREFVMQLGARGVINRKDFDCWGEMPKVGTPEYDAWFKGRAQVRRRHLGGHRQGQQRRFRVRASGPVDVPGLGVRREARRHGRHLRRHHGLQPHDGRALPVDAPEARAGLALRQPAAGSQANKLVVERRIDPCMSEVFPWEQIPKAHMRMYRNEHKPGNMAVLVPRRRRACARSRTCSRRASRCTAARRSSRKRTRQRNGRAATRLPHRENAVFGRRDGHRLGRRGRLEPGAGRRRLFLRDRSQRLLHGRA